MRDQPQQQQQQLPYQSIFGDGPNKLPPISPERKNLPPSPPDTPHFTKQTPVTIASSSQQQQGSTTLPPFSTFDATAAAATAAAPAPSSSQDPVLYPLNNNNNQQQQFSSSVAPLFSQEDAQDRAIRRHIALRRKRERIRKEQSPTFADYKVMVDAVTAASRRSVVAEQYNYDRFGYAQFERKLLDYHSPKMKQYARSSFLKNIVPRTQPKKAQPQAAGPRRRGGAAAASSSRAQRPQRAKRSPQTTPQSLTLNSFDSSPTPRGTATATPSRPARTIGTNRDETHYSLLPDYSPPLDTLQGNTRGLKADWKGQMLDLSRDPDRERLDPAELHLAATLRLSCAAYLASKRRIFAGRLEALRNGKEFRKTDAQQACKIDVNKASKLWAAYDRVGWFDPKFVKPYL